jgi:hypothetical protein
MDQRNVGNGGKFEGAVTSFVLTLDGKDLECAGIQMSVPEVMDRMVIVTEPPPFIFNVRYLPKWVFALKSKKEFRAIARIRNESDDATVSFNAKIVDIAPSEPSGGTISLDVRGEIAIK